MDIYALNLFMEHSGKQNIFCSFTTSVLARLSTTTKLRMYIYIYIYTYTNLYVYIYTNIPLNAIVRLHKTEKPFQN